jgi:hypothetical protein
VGFDTELWIWAIAFDDMVYVALNDELGRIWKEVVEA